MEIKFKRSDEVIKTISVMKIKLPRSEESEIPKVTKVIKSEYTYLLSVYVIKHIFPL